MENNEIMEINEFDNTEVIEQEGKSGMGTGVAMAIGAGLALAANAGIKLVKKIVATRKAKKESEQSDDEDFVEVEDN